MFQFIKELNMIYANENKVTRPVGGHCKFIDEPDQDSNGRTSLNLIRKEGDRMVENRRKSDSFIWQDLLQEAGCPRSSTSESEEGTARKKVYVKRNGRDDREGGYNDMSDAFKDIFMDSESFSQDDCAVEDYELDYYNVSSMINFDLESCDSTRETLERLTCIANELNLPSPIFDSHDEEDDSKRSAIKRQHYFDQMNDVLIGHPDKKIVHTIHHVQELKNDTTNEHHKYSARDWINNPAEKILRTVHPIKKIPGEESILLSSTAKTEENNRCRESSEEESTESSVKAASVHSETEDCETETIFRTVNGMAARLRSSSSCPSFADQSIDGESESDPDSLSCPIGDSCPRIPHPPRGSVHSNSSTTSAYSFAFPILTAEIPSTPPRMSGGNKRQRSPTRTQLQRHPRWKVLFCCKSIK